MIIKMHFTNSILEKIVLPLSDRILGRSISKNLNELLESHRWSRQRLDDHQDYYLRKLIDHSYHNVPYYNDLFKQYKLDPRDIKTKHDLYKIPILTKEVFRKNFPDKISAVNIPQNGLVLQESSGSTGQPLQFYETNLTVSLHKAMAIRAWYWMNYRFGDRYVKISRRPRNSVLKNAQDFLNNSRYIFFDELTEDVFSNIARELESTNPKIIRCYPVPLFYLSQVIERQGGIKVNNLEAVSTTGSTLHPYMREKITEVFNVPVFDSYSCEGGGIFAQCESLTNYHASEEYAISEFVEDDFSKNDPDKSKRHITTDLFNYASPFIRYDTQDYVVPGDSKCICGRDSLTLSKIKGRDSDILFLPDGRYLLEYDFYYFFDASKTINQYQVYQEKKNLIRIRLVINRFFNTKEEKRILEYWKDFLGSGTEISLEIVDKIDLTPTGKRRIIIRNTGINLN